ncbi:MAG: PepSY-associated TM helix domain-containing protein [Pseudomonadota bacterium]
MTFHETSFDLEEFSSSDAGRPSGKPDRTRPASTQKARRSGLWFRIHGLAGLNFSLLLALISLTGTLAVFSAEFDWLITPSMRAAAPVAANDIAWTNIAASLAEYAPNAEIETIEAGETSAFAPAAYVFMSDGNRRVIRFDPVTGAVQGDHAFLGAKSLLRAIHSRLLLGNEIGPMIVSFTAFFLLASLVSALFTYRRWWRGFLRWPKRGRSARVFWGDAHRLAGLWSIAFGFAIALTGIWYFVEDTGGRAPAFERQAFTEADMSNREAAVRFPEALAAVRSAYPDLSIRRIDWPWHGDAGFRFYGQDGTLLVRPRANGIGVDFTTRDVAFRHSGADASMHQRIAEAADPVHMGYFAGFWSKLLWFLSGALLTFVMASGAVIYAKRLTRETDGPIRLRNLIMTLALPMMAIGAMLALMPATVAALS